MARMSEHTGLISPYQLLIIAACTNIGGYMKGSHPRPADRCPFVLKHSISQVTSFMQLRCYDDICADFCCSWPCDCMICRKVPKFKFCWDGKSWIPCLGVLCLFSKFGELSGLRTVEPLKLGLENPRQILGIRQNAVAILAMEVASIQQVTIYQGKLGMFQPEVLGGLVFASPATVCDGQPLLCNSKWAGWVLAGTVARHHREDPPLRCRLTQWMSRDFLGDGGAEGSSPGTQISPCRDWEDPSTTYSLWHRILYVHVYLSVTFESWKVV